MVTEIMFSSVYFAGTLAAFHGTVKRNEQHDGTLAWTLAIKNGDNTRVLQSLVNLPSNPCMLTLWAYMGLRVPNERTLELPHRLIDRFEGSTG